MFRKYLILIIASVTMMISSVLANEIGIIVMHGKGGSPNKYVLELATSLEAKGYLVSNLEMPWSKKRDYDVDIRSAYKEIDTAINGLKSKGAKKLFVAGHSQGGLFALCVGGNLVVDGIIAIAPGGNVGNALFGEKLAGYVNDARKKIEQDKGDEKGQFADFEGAKGAYPVETTPNIYLSWFNPEGEMNQENAIKKVNPNIPILYIVPTQDYPGLLKVKYTFFDALPKNPNTRLYSPKADHVGAPSASIDEIVAWTQKIATIE